MPVPSFGTLRAAAIVVCRPYQQRRAFATLRALWPELDVICSSRPLTLSDYIATIGDPLFVINMIVGDTQRVMEYPGADVSIEQPVPDSVLAADERLVAAGFTSRLIQKTAGARPPHKVSRSASTRGMGRRRPEWHVETAEPAPFI